MRPMKDGSRIYVTSVGETRSDRSQMLLWERGQENINIWSVVGSEKDKFSNRPLVNLTVL